MTDGFSHSPVLLLETIAAIRPVDGGRYIDTTVGGGGHAEKILDLSSPTGCLLGLDADPEAILASRARLSRFGNRVAFDQVYSDQLADTARKAGFDGVDGILYDLGVSSHQIDEAERGFSFARDASLDMRFGPAAARSAYDIVNSEPADELARIFFAYGEERHSRAIARRIVEARRGAPIRTTGQLATIVARAGRRGANERIHPATRVFQALRIAVNEELDRLERSLPQAVSLLKPGGVVAVISFHSLEDRIVKQFIRRESTGCVCPPDLPVCACGRSPALRPLFRKPVTAGPEEIRVNPRARSAKLRAAQKLQQPDIETQQEQVRGSNS